MRNITVAVLAFLVSGCSEVLTPILPPDLAGSWAAVPVAAEKGGAAGLRLEFSIGEVTSDGHATGTGRVGYYHEAMNGTRSWFTYNSVDLTLGIEEGVVTLAYAAPACGSGDTSCRGAVSASYDAATGITGTMTGIYASTGPRQVVIRKCPDAGLVVCWQ